MSPTRVSCGYFGLIESQHELNGVLITAGFARRLEIATPVALDFEAHVTSSRGKHRLIRFESVKPSQLRTKFQQIAGKQLRLARALVPAVEFPNGEVDRRRIDPEGAVGA